MELNPVLPHQRVPGRSATPTELGTTPHVLSLLHHRLRLTLRPLAPHAGLETKVRLSSVQMEQPASRAASLHLGLGTAFFGLSASIRSQLLRLAKPTSWR